MRTMSEMLRPLTNTPYFKQIDRERIGFILHTISLVQTLYKIVHKLIGLKCPDSDAFYYFNNKTMKVCF